MNRQCPDCKVELTEIDIFIADEHGAHVVYSVGERVPVTFLGMKVHGCFKATGRVTGMTCPRCSRVLLFAVPAE